MIKAGQNRAVIKITTIAIVNDQGGGVLPGVKTTYWETWADVSAIKNKRDAQSYQTDLEEPIEFKLRYRSDKHVTKNMMVEYKGNEYTIQSIVNTEERNYELVIVGLTRKWE